MAIGDRAAPRLQPPRPQISQHRAPGLLRFALAAFHGQDHLASIRERPDHDEERRLAGFQAGFDRQPIGPHVDDLQLIEPSPLPGLILMLPLGLEPVERGRRHRRSLAQQPPERELEIAERQSVQIQLGE